MNDILSQHNFRVLGSQLYCEDIPLQQIAEEFGTPLYVYSERQILENYRAFASTLAVRDERHHVSYAVKANTNLEILKMLANEGAGADVASQGELFCALKAGFPASKITFDGPGKTDEEIRAGLNANILAFDVESLEELEVINSLAGELGKIASASIRVNPDVDAKSHPYISTGMKENKFGVSMDDAVDVFLRASRMKNINTVGIHTHIGSQITTLSPFIEAALSVAEFVENLRDKHGIELKYINFGGGQGIRYTDVIEHPLLPHETKTKEKYPPLEKFVHAVVPILEETGCSLIFEPGRAIVANAGVLLTKQLYTKKNDVKEFRIVDAGMSDLIRPCLYDAFHQIVPVNIRKSEFREIDIVGPICESSDFLAQNRPFPDTKRSDILAVMCAGAYGFTMSSNYNMRPRPAEVLVSGDKARLIREREKLEFLT